MVRYCLMVALPLAFLMGCQHGDLKPSDFPDLSGTKKGPGLFSKGDNGFEITLDDVTHPSAPSKTEKNEQK